MMTMREKMAQAIADRLGIKLGEPMHDKSITQCIDAALDALMEPTDGMRATISVADIPKEENIAVGAYRQMLRAAKEGK